MSERFLKISNLLIVILTLLILIFAATGIFGVIDSLKTYTASESSMLYALEEGRYSDLLEYYHRNLAADAKSTETMEECYAIARYYEASLDYQLALLEKDSAAQSECQKRMEEAALQMGELSYAEDEINALFHN